MICAMSPEHDLCFVLFFKIACCVLCLSKEQCCMIYALSREHDLSFICLITFLLLNLYGEHELPKLRVRLPFTFDLIEG